MVWNWSNAKLCTHSGKKKQTTRNNFDHIEYTLGLGNGQGGLECGSPCGHRVGHAWATELDWNDALQWGVNQTVVFFLFMAPGVLTVAFFLTFFLGNYFSFRFEMSPYISKPLQCFPQERIKGNTQVGFIKMMLNSHLKWFITHHLITFNFHKYHRLLIHTHQKRIKPETDLCIFTVIRTLRDALESAHEGTSASALQLPEGPAARRPFPGVRPRPTLGTGEMGSAAVWPARGEFATWLRGWPLWTLPWSGPGAVRKGPLH